MTPGEREAISRLLLGVRKQVEAIHETISGVLQLLNDEPQPEPSTRPRPRFMGDGESTSGGPT